jgi:hypothetical protein
MFSERFGRMAEAKCPVPEYLQCMIVLSKIPQNMGVLSPTTKPLHQRPRGDETGGSQENARAILGS